MKMIYAVEWRNVKPILHVSASIALTGFFEENTVSSLAF